MSLGTPPETKRARLNEAVSNIIRKYRDTRLGKFLLLTPALLAILLMMIVPMLILVDFSFNPFIGGEIAAGFTLNHYARALLGSFYQSVLFRTVKIATIVTVLAFLLGFPLAYAAVRSDGLLGTLIIISTLAPLTIDLVIRSFGWFVLLSDNGLVVTALQLVGVDNPPQLLFNDIGIVIGLTHVMLPFMVFPMVNVLHTIPYSLEEAAQNLGANRLTVFTKILLPLALPGISAGVLITFMVAMASYVTPAILGGGVKVVPVLITDTFTSTSNWPFASALSMILVTIALLVIVGYQRVLKRIKETGGV